MRELDLFKKYDEPVVIALGFFDCLHKGHVSLISKALSLAKKLNTLPVVFTFKNDIATFLKKEDGVIFTYYERIENLEKLKINTVISTVFTKEFSEIEHKKFLDLLFENFNVKAIVCGEDFRYGKGGEGNATELKEYSVSKGSQILIENEICCEGKKISTSNIKRLLSQGDVDKANQLMEFPYQISGEVVCGRKVGRKLGFPTANVNVNSEKSKIKNGVYKTQVKIDDKVYNSITNYGARPTYGLEEILTETFIKGFDGDLYGRKITIIFCEFLRDCIKFESEAKLKEQIKYDLEKIND